jgi:carbamoyltransferase
MIVLGIHGGERLANEDAPVGYANHDAAAVLLRDGEVIAAIEEERLTRIKHTNCFPANAVRFCLEKTGTGWSEVTYVATNTSKNTAAVSDAIALLDGDRELLREPGLARIFRRTFGVDVSDRLMYCNHHLAHAWSALVPSGYEQSLVVSLDGNGDGLSGMVLVGGDSGFRVLRRYSDLLSLGHLYVSLIRVAGFSRFEEYKAMGLAPYGDPDRYQSILAKMFRLLQDGNYELEDPIKRSAILYDSGLLDKMRLSGEPFAQHHKDFAAAVQKMLETIVLHILTAYKIITSERNLCLAGGVAHNCSLNGAILNAGIFDNVFVQPAAHDAGGALGAAWWAVHEVTACRPRAALPHLFYGTDIGSQEDIHRDLDKWARVLDVEEVTDIAGRTARLISGGAVVAWVQGSSEFGPRALGNRSIIADPRPPDHKILINQLVKKREEFRPFAPSVLAERAAEIFELPLRQNEFPFMTFVVKVRSRFASRLGAVTHVDGTARIQTVSKASNQQFWALLDAFDKLTGIPVLLNTSFNNNAEPIVDSVDDAVTCFLTTGLSHLIIGRFIVTKKPVAERGRLSLILAPSLAAHRRLTRGTHRDGTNPSTYVSEIRSTKSRFFGPVAVPISDEVFAVMAIADGQRSLEELLRRACVPNEHHLTVADDLFNLWSQRFIVCLPVSGGPAT